MHHSSVLPILLFAAALSTADRGAAQSPPVALELTACGLQNGDDGQPFGFGADYEVRFLPAGFEFLPMLGKAAPRDLPLAVEVTHVGRGELRRVGDARRERHRLRVDYVRAAFIERLDLRPEGMEQSFVFEALPPGDGDLVVRARVDTELRLEPASGLGDAQAHGTTGLRFSWPGAGGVQIGGVTGIDANGRRCAGELRYRDNSIEMVLPAAFVDSAALPLVLDPLLSPVLVISSNAADERQVSIARMGGGSALSAVVFRRTISALNSDAFVAILSDTGGVTATFSVENFSNVSPDQLRIAGCPNANAWLVAWVQAGNINCRRLQPNGPGSSLLLASGSGNETGVVVSGGSGGTRVLAAWLDEGADRIFGCEVDVGSEPPVKLATSTLATDSGLFSTIEELDLPRQSDSSQLLLAYSVRSTVTNQFSLRGQFLTAATPATLNGASFAIAGSTNVSANGAAVAGDGRTWVVAHRTSGTVVGNGASCVAVHRSGNSAVLSAPRSLVATGTTIGDLDAAWAGGSALIALSRLNGSLYDVLLLSLDPLNCGDCEGTMNVDLAGNDTFVGVAAAADGSAAVAWAPVVGGLGNVALQRFRADDGAFAQVAEGPFGENISATCARVGRADFGIELHGGAANVPAFAMLASSRIDASCGFGNVVVPDFLNGFVAGAGSTSAVGDLRLALPIPNNPTLSGLGLFVQFARPGATCFGAFELSSAVQFTIQ